MDEFDRFSHNYDKSRLSVRYSGARLAVGLFADGIGPAGGVLGSRMTGGGFGGSTVTLCRTDNAVDIAATLEDSYRAKTQITPQIFASRPAQGAHLL